MIGVAMVEPRSPSPVCTLPRLPVRLLPPDISTARARLIRMHEKIWVNGTVLRYFFFRDESHGSWVQAADGTMQWYSWNGDDIQEDVVRQAFKVWQELGLGLSFAEVDQAEDTEIRIGFMRGDGSWSYVGRDSIDYARDPLERTMNFGWDLTSPWGFDTALHEIGHVLGLPHEHQNPNTGIVWNEAEVYRRFSEAPNHWDRDTIYWNILRKHEQDAVDGSPWDPNSIMHYPFEAGLIEQPEIYRHGLKPEPGLSKNDIDWARQFYPPQTLEQYPRLVPLQSVRLDFAPGEQRDLWIRPDRSSGYTLQTFGKADVVMVLFTLQDGEPNFMAGDDDSGLDRNALLRVELEENQDYLLRVRLYYTEHAGETAVMMW